MKKLKDLIFNYQTKYKEGFINKEVDNLLKKEILPKYPNFNIDKFNDALFGNTCAFIDNQIVNYPHDIYKAVLCGIENRNLHPLEFD